VCNLLNEAVADLRADTLELVLNFHVECRLITACACPLQKLLGDGFGTWRLPARTSSLATYLSNARAPTATIASLLRPSC
jgi:hypothetical protein